MEEGGDRWSKPHVATISLHSLFELRSCILNGTVMLDLEGSSLDQIAGKKLYLLLWQTKKWLNIVFREKQYYQVFFFS